MSNLNNQNHEKTSSLLHGSKSESNLFSSLKDTTEGISLLNTATSMQSMPNNSVEDMVTSTPAPSEVVNDHEFQTPRRGAVFSKSSAGSASSSKNCIKFKRSNSERTPSSGPRINPFDSQISVDRLHLPTCSPSVFSIVVSPSQENVSSASSEKFWSLDQRARLFPAHISDDSPWKQEAASSRLDQDTENKTQEALDLYFSQHHHVTTPEDVPLITASSLQNRSIGNSPNLTSEAAQADEKSDTNNSSGSTSIIYDQGQTCRSTQTLFSLPTVLPPELENILVKYGLVNNADSVQVPGEEIKTLAPSTIAWGKRTSNSSEGNISNSTLRRKLFAGMIQDDDDSDDDFEEDFSDDKNSKVLSDDKENCESTAMVISPGKIMMTPNAQRIPSSPNKSLCWSMSPVSRQKRPNTRNTPIGASTPTRF